MGKKVSAISFPRIPADKNTLLLGGAVLALAYFGIVHPILVKLGIFKTADEKKQDQARKNALQDTMQKVFASQDPTYSLAELSNYTEVIYESLRYSALDDDKSQAVLYLKKARNDADVYHMIDFFGNREECYFGVLCYMRSLPELVSSNLSQSDIDSINQTYNSRGITFRW